MESRREDMKRILYYFETLRNLRVFAWVDRLKDMMRHILGLHKEKYSAR